MIGQDTSLMVKALILMGLGVLIGGPSVFYSHELGEVIGVTLWVSGSAFFIVSCMTWGGPP